MIGWILSACGLGGLGIVTYLVGPRAVLGFARTAFAALAKVPWQVWAALAALALGWFAWHWHEGQVKKADKAGYERRGWNA
jgi:hypothetical protein